MESMKKKKTLQNFPFCFNKCTMYIQWKGNKGVQTTLSTLVCTLRAHKQQDVQRVADGCLVVWLWQLCIKRAVDHPCPAPALPPGGETCPPARSSSSQVRTWRWNCFFLNQLKMKGMEGWATAGWWWATGRGAEDNRLAAQSQSAAHQCSLPRLPLHRNMRMVIGLVTEFFSKQCLFCKTFLTTSNLLCIRPEHSKGTRHNFNSGYLLLPFTDCFQSTAE